MADPLSLIIGTVGSLAGSALNNAANNRYQREALDLQTQKAKELMDYQNEKFGTQAQLDTYARNGFNLGAMVNGGNLPLSVPSPSLPSMPQLGTGLMSLKELGSFISDVANAKKAGVDTSKSEQEIRNMQVKEQADNFELELRKYFAKPQIAAELALAYQNVLLAQDTHDMNEINKAVGEWNKVKSKAEAQTSEHTRDIVKKRLDNTDKELQLANRESEARGTASFAAAEASRTQADVNRENRRLQSALADIEEGAKSDKIEALIAQYQKEGWLSEADAAEARVRASRLHDIENKRESKFFKAIDDYSEWLKSKLKIFSK